MLFIQLSRVDSEGLNPLPQAPRPAPSNDGIVVTTTLVLGKEE